MATVTTTTTIKPLIIRTKVSVTDPNYFCNVSWTLSHSMITNSWISFHSYIPRYYVGENNFFYTGIKSCCVSFDFKFIAGELVPNPPTTTTTTLAPTTSTTTSTTTIPLDCFIDGEVVLTECDLAGTGIITVPPIIIPCDKSQVSAFTINTGYTAVTPPTTVVSTATFIDACNAKQIVRDNLGNALSTKLIVYSNSLILGSTVYNNILLDDCTVIPNGFYFTDVPNDPIYEIVNGVIVSITPCFSVTTTTTTCSMYLYTFAVYNCGLCLQTSIGTLGNSQALTIGKYYYDPVTDAKIRIIAFTGCSGGVDRNILDSTQKDNCPSVVCL